MIVSLKEDDPSAEESHYSHCRASVISILFFLVKVPLKIKKKYPVENYSYAINYIGSSFTSP